MCSSDLVTSLVAVDVTPSRPADDHLETQEVPTNLPHGWNFEKVFGEDPNNRAMETSIDPAVFGKLAVVDKPVAVSTDGGVALPQTDAGTNIVVFLGILMLMSGAMILALALFNNHRK